MTKREAGARYRKLVALFDALHAEANEAKRADRPGVADALEHAALALACEADALALEHGLWNA